ncbi:MAG TPA: hypothetical protein VNI02_03895 [Blastocatellia bacterium]|jgi:hypothetical protein|nr:hypothetical protein [Blastocatellia bacterium]
MSSASQSTDAPGELERAERLKHQLVEFATSGILKDEYQRQHQLFFELSTPADEHEAESVLDWFLFDWFDEQGEGVIDYFLESRADLSEEDQDTLLDWQDSINSVFEIRSMGKNAISLEELDGGDSFTVTTVKPLSETPLKRGQFIAARLLPLGDKFIFSGLQFIMPDRQSAMEALEMRRALEALDSPEAIENAQREQVSAFCELFGCDELTVSPGELHLTLQKFQNFLFTQRRDPETGLTAAERFQQEFGRELNVPEMPPLPTPLTSAGEVTILCDDFDGIVLLPDFGRFRRVFVIEDPDADLPDWQDLMWKYIKDPDIPIVAFERVAEQVPDRVEMILRKLIGDDSFSIEHLYAMLLHYKQPVDGLDDLKDEQQLWDLFNGNGSDPSEAKTSAKAGAKKAAAVKGKAAASKKQPAKKKPGLAAKKAGGASARSAAKKSATAKSAAKKSPAKKSPAKKSAAKKSAAKGSASIKSATGKGGARKGTSAKRR